MALAVALNKAMSLNYVLDKTIEVCFLLTQITMPPINVKQ
jgi:hypothetical protein